LKDHPDAAAEIDHIEPRTIYVDAFDPDGTTGNVRAIHKVIHPVETPEESGLTATRRSNECGHCAPLDLQADVMQDMIAAVGKIEVVNLDDRCLLFLRRDRGRVSRYWGGKGFGHLE